MTARTALVTGGSRGIGLAITEVFKRREISVIAPSRADLNLSDPKSVAAWCVVNQHHQIDILVNNAGINELASMDTLNDSSWQMMLQTNLTAPFQLARAMLPGMITRGWGRIVNIASIWGIVAKAHRGGYAATKAGLIGMTRVLAIEGAAHGVIANAVCPGYVATEMTRANNGPEELAKIAKLIPIGRLAEPHEIAKTVWWLCSEENTYLCGQTIMIDGGFTAI